MDRTRIAILGAGAVGGYYGARLAQHGHDVHFLMRGDYRTVREKGLTIKSVGGDFALPPKELNVYDDAARMPAVDLVIVTLKSTENHQFPRLIPPMLHERTVILTLQNGLGNEEELARLFGPERVIGGMAFVCINRVAPGVIHHMHHGFIRIGEFTGNGKSQRTQQISGMFNAAGISCGVLDNLLHGRWDKLVWNIPFNGLSTLLDRTTDQLINTDEGVALVTAIMNEVLATARSAGVELPADLPARKIQATRSMGAYQTSTQIDRRNGKAMEIAAIFGQPLEIAHSAGLPVPLLEMLHFTLSQLNENRKLTVS